jgi:hypothetical protein
MAKKSYNHMIDFTLAGIPCIIGVSDYYKQDAQGRGASNDWDCYGYSEWVGEILDRKGYPAEWLERKITCKIQDQIDRAVDQYFA